MISHFYLQRSETRTKRHQASASSYLDEKNIAPELRAKYAEMGIEESPLADVESAFASTSIVNKIMYDKVMQTKKDTNKAMPDDKQKT